MFSAWRFWHVLVVYLVLMAALYTTSLAPVPMGNCGEADGRINYTYTRGLRHGAG